MAGGSCIDNTAKCSADPASPTPTAFPVRLATPADAAELARLFYETIHMVNARDYTPEQIHAWAPQIGAEEKWQERQKARQTFVAVSATGIAGFGELEDSGHIDCFYCHKDYQGVGAGSSIMQNIVDAATRLGLRRLYAEVSITARPFFEHRGFQVVREQQVSIRGQSLTNFVMERYLK